MKYKHLIFDFFGTLVKYKDGVINTNSTTSYNKLCEYGFRGSCNDFNKKWNDCFVTLERTASKSLKEYHMNDVLDLFLKNNELFIDGKDQRKEFIDLFIDDWNKDVVYMNNIKDILNSFKIPASIVTNTHYPDLISNHLIKMEIKENFHYIITSIEYGYRKPYPGIFHFILNKLKLESNDVLYVGDDVQCDYFGPQAVGIDAVLIVQNNIKEVPKKNQISNLSQLKEVLK